MKKIGIIILMMVLLVGCGPKETVVEVTSNGEDNVKTANTYVELLAEENFSEAYTAFAYTEEMKKAVNEKVYKQIWDALIEQQGKYIAIAGFTETEAEGFNIVSIITEFENGKINLNVVFDEGNNIAGFNFTPYIAEGDMPADEPIEGDAEEIRVTIISGEYEIDAMLTIPGKDGNYPAVLLVPGSGPTDMDETILANKPFKDIARGLAKEGVASLRFDKRTIKYGMEMLNMEFTLKEEYLDDVESGFKLLLNNENIDNERIYILGHSLGGNLIPRIAGITDDAAGYIMAAASASNLEDLMIKQYNYIFSLDGEIDKQEKEQLGFVEEAIKRIKEVDENSKYTASDLIGAPKSYWIDMRENNPYNMTDNVTKPLLVIQGAKDYQVTMEEFELWKEAFKEKSNVEFKSYENLNHLFMESQGTPSPNEYEIPQKVSAEVITDIANFIK